MTELAGQLAAAVGGAQVDASTRRRAEYSSDASNYRVVPQVVVFPRDSADVEIVQGITRELHVPLTSRGAGTSVAGNAVGDGVVLDFSRHMNRLLELDPIARTASVQPGLILDDLQRAAAVHGLRFGPDPSTHSRCTLGGMIGNDACGSHALAYGRTSANVLGLTVLDGRGRTFDTTRAPEDLVAGLGTIAARNLATLRTQFGTFGRQVSGYALENLLPENNSAHRLARLLCGSEGTLAITLAARLRLVRAPENTSLVVLGFPDMIAAAEATPALLERKPQAMEGIDRRLVDAVRAGGGSVAGLPDGNGWLFVEIGAPDAGELLATARRAGATGGLLITDPQQARALWRIREDGAGLAGRTSDGRPAWPGWEDAAVPPARLAGYLRDFQALMRRHRYDGLIYGHFGDGCLHVRIDFPLDRPDGGRPDPEFLLEAATLVAAHGGSLSGEHGDGRARSELLPLMYSPAAITAFAQVKALFDPEDGLNPGVIVAPRPLAADLRLSAAPTGSFATEVHRCVGVGKCRADSGGVMCPSFLATGDEKDSTRGRARVLQEMVNGGLITAGWRSPEVLESLDLCLSCKGCAVDCPAGVDMATYKSEFLDQHYRHRLRPRSHYLLGRLPRWAALAARAPGLVNRLLALPGVAALARAAAGIDPRRPLPAFAVRPFREDFQPGPGSTPVILWVDTFTQYFDPAVGAAAVAVLEHLGFAVTATERQVCCGLTWVTTGQLDGARRQLRAALDALAAAGGAEVPIVGLEPSCTALLRDDAARLLPDDPRARALGTRVLTLAELIARYRPDWSPPQIAATAAVQPHCHQQASIGFTADRTLLAKAGIDPDVLAGCCGLAGNFGVEKGHHDLSVKIAARSLLPALAGDPDLVIADGYSCRTQAEQLAGRRPVHLAEVLANALLRVDGG